MKYKLTQTTKIIGITTLYQIEAIQDFGTIKKGDLGGWIESEKNLSQTGNAWVHGNARVFGDARVYGNAQMYDDAQVYEGIHMGSKVFIDKAKCSCSYYYDLLGLKYEAH